MDKLIAQLDSLVASPRDSISDTTTDSRAASVEATTSATAEEVFVICEDQSKRLRELSQENQQLRDNMWQLKTALNYSRELHTTANSDRKAACNALMELERQLEIALREKKALDEGLQKASKLLEEHRNKSVMDSRKLEQTQAMYDELKVKQKKQLEDEILRSSGFGTDISDSVNLTKLEEDLDKKLEQKNNEISEQAELLKKQNLTIIKQKEEICCLQNRIEQLAQANSLPFKEESKFRSIIRRSFRTRQKKMQSSTGEASGGFSRKVC